MSYLVTGTVYPTNISLFAPSQNPQSDYVSVKYMSNADQTVTGTSSSSPITTNLVLHSYSGTNVYQITAATPSQFRVVDVFGLAGIANLTISGTLGNLIKGSGIETVNDAYGYRELLLVSGTAASSGAWTVI
jgi:hypothetical protein